MATGNIDCPISERICSLQQLNLNIFNNSDISDSSDDPQTCLSMQHTIPSNINTASFKESESIEEFTNQLLNECARRSSDDDNKNCETKQSPKTPIDSSKDSYSAIMNDNNKNSLFGGNLAKHDSYAIFQSQNLMPEELFINVESDDEGVHSWRPNMFSNALCSDFFVTPGLVCEDLNLNFPIPLQSKTDDFNETDGNTSKWTSEMPNSPLVLNSKSPHFQPSNQITGHSKVDMSSLLCAQVAGLNTVRYETINARRKIAELKEEVQKFNRKLNEKLIVQRTLDVERLREENAQLRLEVQCLCMEVDYYLKGQAPLGEIDETFYQGNPPSQRNISTCQDLVDDSPGSTQSNSSDDLEDQQKWECQVCTFANHPAINSCEMCQTQRSYGNLSHGSPSDSKDSCFCHPEKDTS